MPCVQCYEVVATRMCGGASMWMNTELQRAYERSCLPWVIWATLKEVVCARFEPINREERVRTSLRVFTQIESVQAYVHWFD